MAVANPILTDNNSKFEINEIATGISFPSGMELIDQDILITEQYSGKIKLIRDFDLKKYPIANVDSFSYGKESGLMSISSMKKDNSTIIFLYFTGRHNDSVFTSSGSSNMLYSYIWNASGLELTDEKLILDIPINNVSQNYSGKIEIGPDGQMYITIGHLNKNGLEQNIVGNRNFNNIFVDTTERSGAIMRISTNGTPSHDNPFSENGFEEYFAFGIRAAKDLAFDPVTKQLWDIEQGPNSVYEINIIDPGFNSGWKRIHGYLNQSCCSPDLKLPQDKGLLFQPKNSYYADPRLLITNSSDLTAITFMNNSSTNPTFHDSVFIGDMEGNIFRFGLDKDRTFIYNSGQILNHLFAEGFGPIVDLEINENGILYILSYSNSGSGPYKENTGSVYAISMKDELNVLTPEEIVNIDSFGIIGILIVLLSLIIFLTYKSIKHMVQR